jgi:hypothetical protein
MTFERREKHQRNPKLESLLTTLNDLLAEPETRAISHLTAPQYPIVFVVGCARSGSTLLTQWIADLGLFGYPSNLLSRFYKAPYIGALIQNMLTHPDYAFREEMIDFQAKEIDYTSSLGKTAGALSPNSFQYFWRQFFDFGVIQKLDPDALETVDRKTLSAELAALEQVFEKPLAMKAMFLNWHIEFLYQIFPNALFLHIQRNPLMNAQSLLSARQDFYGSIEPWYSYKPPEYAFLKDQSPYAQVAGQVLYTNRAITGQLAKIPKSHWLDIDYDSFCDDPASVYSSLLEILQLLSYGIPSPYEGPASFKKSDRVRLSDQEVLWITEALNNYQRTTI